MSEKKILVFESGTPNAGGSFSEKLVRSFNNHDKTFYKGTVVGVVSHISYGGVSKMAHKLGIPFYFLPSPWSGEEYKDIIEESGANIFVFVDWKRAIRGLDPETVFNSNNAVKFHLGPFPQYSQSGSIGFYGRDTSEYLLRKFKANKIEHSAIVAHFVTEEFAESSIFYQTVVPIFKEDTIFDYENRINQSLCKLLPMIINSFIKKEMSLIL